jgi:hypothetical protein
MLSPAIAHGQRSEALEVEVATRTREIEAQRRFMEKVIDSLPSAST